MEVQLGQSNPAELRQDQDDEIPKPNTKVVESTATTTGKPRKTVHIPVLQNPKPSELVRAELATASLFLLVCAFSLVLPYLKQGPTPLCRPCMQANQYLSRAGDTSADPCDDFYEHVCGSWQNSGFESYLADVMHTGRDKQRVALSSYSDAQGSWVYSMLSFVFNSCYRELEVTRDVSYMADKISELTGLSWSVLSRSRDVAGWIHQLAGMSVKHSVTPIFSVTYNEPSRRLVIRPVRRNRALGQYQLKHLLKEAKTVLISYNISDDMYDRVLHLHTKVLEALNAKVERVNFPGDCAQAFSQLGQGSPDAWADALNADFLVHFNVTATTTVMLRDVTTLRSLLDAFFAEVDAVRGLYLYVHLLRRASSLASRSGIPGLADKICLKEMDRPSLSPAYHAFSVHALADGEVRKMIRLLFSRIFLETLTVVAGLKTLREDVRAEFIRSWRTLSLNTIFDADCLSPRELETLYEGFPRKLTFYNSTSFDSIGRTEKFGAIICDFSRKQPIYFGTRFCLSPAVLVPPMFYPGASVAINYGSLGFIFGLEIVRALMKIMRAGSWEQQKVVEAIRSAAQRCHSGSPLYIEDASAVTLGLRAAFSVFTAQLREPLMEKAIDGDEQGQWKTFFRRACLLTCRRSAYEASRMLIKFSAREACNLAIMNMPEFYRAFGCKFNVTKKPKGICNAFL